jgi:hypothetical protein
MAQVHWQVASSGAYLIDVMVGDIAAQTIIDLGLTDPSNQVGLALDPDIYDRLKQSQQLSRFRARLSRDASGRYSTIETAFTTARLIDPLTGQAVGPAVRLFASRGAPGVPNRVGVPFFHHLSRCSVIWELNRQTWTIEYPEAAV